MAFKPGIRDGRHGHGIHAHARFDGLDLDARSQWVRKSK